jgi:hypothetical protein
MAYCFSSERDWLPLSLGSGRVIGWQLMHLDVSWNDLAEYYQRQSYAARIDRLQGIPVFCPNDIKRQLFLQDPDWI